jgi:hypothetical protein
MSPTERGKPGSYALQLASQRRKPGIVVGAISLLAVVIGWYSWPENPTLTLVSLAAAALAVGVARHYFDSAAKAMRGVKAERVTAKALRNSRCSELVHGALIGAGGDADHIVLGPMLAVVETKSGAGVVQVKAGRVQVGARVLPGDPASQVRRQATSLGRIAGAWADAVVCVPGMINQPLHVDGVTICSARDLPGVIAGLPHRVGGHLAASLAQRLADGEFERATRPAVKRKN